MKLEYENSKFNCICRISYDYSIENSSSKIIITDEKKNRGLGRDIYPDFDHFFIYLHKIYSKFDKTSEEVEHCAD